MSWLCQAVEEIQDRLLRVEQLLDYLDIRAGRTAKLVGGNWEVSNQQIAQWVAGTPLPLSDSSEYVRFKDGNLEIRGGVFSIHTGESGAHMTLDGTELKGYDTSGNLTVHFNWDAGTIWAKSGGFGGTSASPVIVLDNATANVFVPQPIYLGDDATGLVVGGQTAGGVPYIQSANFSTGVTGWRIDNDGDAEFNSVTVRGTIYASAGQITGTLTIESGGSLESAYVTIDDNGITVDYDSDQGLNLEADSGGTLFDKIYHDATSDALNIESATEYWQILERDGAKLAANGQFLKWQTRPDVEMMDNGGFETAGSGGETFDDWTFSGTDGSVSDETSSVNEGSHAARLTAGASKDARIAQTIDPGFDLAGYDVTLTFYTRGDGTKDGRYRVWANGAGSYAVGTTLTGVTGTSYTKVTKTFTCPAGTTSIIVTFMCPNTNTNYAMFDSASCMLNWASPSITIGDADNNWATFTASDTPGLTMAIGTGSDPSPAVEWREHRLIPTAGNDRRLPQMVWIGIETDANSYVDILNGVSYVWANLAAFNVDTGAAIAHCIAEVVPPSSGNTDTYFSADRTYLYATSGQLYMRVRDDNYVILYNDSTADVRWLGWVMYWTA